MHPGLWLTALNSCVQSKCVQCCCLLFLLLYPILLLLLLLLLFLLFDIRMALTKSIIVFQFGPTLMEWCCRTNSFTSMTNSSSSSSGSSSSISGTSSNSGNRRSKNTRSKSRSRRSSSSRSRRSSTSGNSSRGQQLGSNGWHLANHPLLVWYPSGSWYPPNRYTQWIIFLDRHILLIPHQGGGMSYTVSLACQPGVVNCWCCCLFASHYSNCYYYNYYLMFKWLSQKASLCFQILTNVWLKRGLLCCQTSFHFSRSIMRNSSSTMTTSSTCRRLDNSSTIQRRWSSLSSSYSSSKVVSAATATNDDEWVAVVVRGSVWYGSFLSQYI